MLPEELLSDLQALADANQRPYWVGMTAGSVYRTADNPETLQELGATPIRRIDPQREEP